MTYGKPLRDKFKIKQALTRGLKQKKSRVIVEFHHSNKRKQHFWDIQFDPILGDDGALSSILVTARDVTKDHTLSEQSEFYKSKIELAKSTANILVWDLSLHRSGTMLFEDRKSKSSEKLGISNIEHLDHFLNLVHIDDRQRAKRELKNCFNEISSYDDEFRMKFDQEKTYRWYRHKGTVSRENDIIYIHGISMDTSDYKETELALRQSEKRLSLAQKAGDIGVYEWLD